jgi:hypothetical protein
LPVESYFHIVFELKESEFAGAAGVNMFAGATGVAGDRDTSFIQLAVKLFSSFILSTKNT